MEVLQQGDDALLQGGGHAQLAKVGLNVVRKLGERAGLEGDRLGGGVARSGVVLLAVGAEEGGDLLEAAVGEEEAALAGETGGQLVEAFLVLLRLGAAQADAHDLVLAEEESTGGREGKDGI